MIAPHDEGDDVIVKKLLNTLYISSDDIFLSLENNNALLWRNSEVFQRLPLHTLDGIVIFSRKRISVPLITECARQHIPIFFLNNRGNLLAKVQSPNANSIALRRLQFRLSDQEESMLPYAQAFMKGKIRNSRHTLDRFLWTCKDEKKKNRIRRISDQLSVIENQIAECTSLDSLRAMEGEAAAAYFSVFNDLILKHEEFIFHGRSKRPPLDEVNALLSFSYTLLHNECTAALESSGLDASIGFMHLDHPGRYSLACDLMEEMRSCIADRFVLSLINNQVLTQSNFEQKADGAVYLSKSGRSLFLSQWQRYKSEEILHPVFQEKMAIGMIPLAQSILLVKAIREDIKEYPPFFRK